MLKGWVIDNVAAVAPPTRGSKVRWQPPFKNKREWHAADVAHSTD